MLDKAVWLCFNSQTFYSYLIFMNSSTIFQKADEATVALILDWLRNQERHLYRSALNELTALKKLRPQFIRQKPLAEQFAWIKKMLAWMPANTIADHLLQVWLVRKHEAMLVDFLNILGIGHNGHGMVEEALPESLDAAKLKLAIDDIFAKHPAGIASVYLQMFQNQTTKGWTELAEVLEADERFTLR